MSDARDTFHESTTGQVIAAAALVVATASAAYQFVNDQGEPGLRFVLLALLTGLVWWARVPAVFAAAFGACTLLAAWASVEHWYRGIPWADEVVHLIAPGSLAAAAYFLLVRARVLLEPQRARSFLRSWALVVWVTLVGVSAAVLWEFYEWTMEQLSPQGMRVGYTDTVGDLLAGAVGSMVAGLLVVRWARWQEQRAPEKEGSAAHGADRG